MNAQCSPGKVMVGLSGGVDSAVAALLLCQQGYQVTGLFMKNWEEDDTRDYCAAAKDLADAQAVADALDIPLRTINFATEYWDRVFTHFLHEYQAGRTPNPDILCNREIKFKAFLDHALELGADWIATGHYAGIRQDGQGYHLLRAKDANKDQTYFLYALGQRALSRSLFPLREWPKTAVRALASAHGLPNAHKKDSTGICFIGERKLREFLQPYLPAQPGLIVTPDGQPLGEHPGLMYFTLGQRQGLGIGGIRGVAEAPWYVVAKDLPRNQLVVAQDFAHPWLMHDELFLTQVHWILDAVPHLEQPFLARIRHRQGLQPCRLQTASGERIKVLFDQPQRAATPGQSVVLYDGEECLGGGVIEEFQA